MDEYCFLVSAKYFDCEDKEKTENLLLYAVSMKAAMDKIDFLYGDDLINVSIESIDCSAPLTFSDEDCAIIRRLLDGGMKE